MKLKDEAQAIWERAGKLRYALGEALWRNRTSRTSLTTLPMP